MVKNKHIVPGKYAKDVIQNIYKLENWILSFYLAPEKFNY